MWGADALGVVVEALTSQLGAVAFMPVVPRSGAAAIRVLVRAVKSGSGGMRDYPALVLNDHQGRPSAAAEALMRGGAPLAIAEG
jgi:tRNA1(Val) A37 N6-methylase TrmN6